MRKRQAAAQEAYEQQWNNGKGSHHPDFDPDAVGEGLVRASRATEELYNAIVKNDISMVRRRCCAAACMYLHLCTTAYYAADLPIENVPRFLT